MEILSREFYLQNAEKVARGLLGKIIVRRFGSELLMARIVETEAYYGRNDPASRAYNGLNKISELMYGEPGRILIYTVHNNLMLNVVAHEPGEIGAVLIRALEPIKGVEIMGKYRDKGGFDISNGPGKLTEALKLSKDYHNISIYDEKSPLMIIDFGSDDNNDNFRISSSNRIGVKKDLKKKLRFFIKGSKWVSKGSMIAEEFY